MLRDFYDPFHAKIKDSDQIDRSTGCRQRLVGIDPKDDQPIYAPPGTVRCHVAKGRQ